ncbi:hypothetical protein F2Q69_00044654 [Brassica cretica]|uniref:Uncharacterized protein n=1 Tax=Brassica cretica TaxID=69181 RepID=A0A8S9NGC8_BRACR|nr:hypothetical protein F2Q69_00044654 [Brassica cretica]
MNIDDMKFDQLAGILKVHDLEEADELLQDSKGIAFLAESKEEDDVKRLEDNLSLMARNFNKMLKQIKKGVKNHQKTTIVREGFQSSSNQESEYKLIKPRKLGSFFVAE